MASIFTPNIDSATVATGKQVLRDVSGQRTLSTGGQTTNIHKADRKVMAAAGITN